MEKVTGQCPQTTTFLKRKRAKADSNRGPSAYQPNALPMDLYNLDTGQCLTQGFQARSKDQEILVEGGGAGPSLLPRRDHE